MTYVLRNSHFSNKETAFSGPWVVWSLFGAPGEKKRQNQMFLQDLHSFAPLQSQILQIFRIFFRENFRIFSDVCKITNEIAKMNGAKDCKFEFGAVQRNANLVDLENPCKMRLFSLS